MRAHGLKRAVVTLVAMGSVLFAPPSEAVMFQLIHCFPLPQGAFQAYRGPLVVDLDGDGLQEIGVEDDLSNVWLLDHRARVLPGWPNKPVLQGRGYSSMAAANVYTNNGQLEFVHLQNDDNAGADVVNVFDKQGLAQQVDTFRLGNRLFNAIGDLYVRPALADMGGSSRPELVIPPEWGALLGFEGDSFTGNVIDFLQGWPFIWDPLGDLVSEVAVGDMNGDLNNDVVVSGNLVNLAAVNVAGRPVAVYQTNERVLNSPALGDVDGDGRLEVVAICSDRGSPTGVVYIWKRNGVLVRRWPVKGVQFGSPSLGDLDADNDLEICAVSMDGQLYAWNQNGTLVDGNGDGRADFPVRIFNDPRTDFQAIPLIADLDGQPDAEILVLSKRIQKMCAYHQDGRPVADFPLPLPGPAELRDFTAPVISDINGDGLVEIVVAWGGKVCVYSTVGRADDVQWGSFAHDHQNSRNYEFKIQQAVPR